MDDHAIAHIALFISPFLLALVIRRKSQPYLSRLFDSFLLIGVGVQGMLVGLQQVTRGQELADYVDWAFSPFVAELGIMNVAFGILGLVAPFAGREWKMATAIGYAFYLAWSTVGHVVEAIAGNQSPGNTGAVVWVNAAIAIALLVLLLETRFRPPEPEPMPVQFDEIC